MIFEPGRVVVRRFVHPDGRLAAVHAARVVADDERGLTLFSDVGAARMHRVDLTGTPTRPLPLATELAMATTLAPAARQTYRSLILMPPGAGHSVSWGWLADGTFAGWYVNLESPARRWPGGVDTHDQTLDVRVAADRSWAWKDADEFAASPYLDDAARRRIRAEGERVIALAGAGTFPFDGSLTGYRPPASWAPTAMPPWWDAIAA